MNEQYIKRRVVQAYRSALFVFPPLVLVIVFFHLKIRRASRNGFEKETIWFLEQIQLTLKWGMYVAMVLYLAAAFIVFGKGGELIPAMGSFY
ncbi:MAG: hypothetical protein AAFZ15_13455 [Bacteroidota bacterium]